MVPLHPPHLQLLHEYRRHVRTPDVQYTVMVPQERSRMETITEFSREERTREVP